MRAGQSIKILSRNKGKSFNMITTLPIIEETQNKYIENLKEFSQQKFEMLLNIIQIKKKKSFIKFNQKESILYRNPDPGKYFPDYKFVNK